MFKLPTALPVVTGRTQTNPFIKRAALFGGALLLLLIAFQLLPSSPAPAPVYSDGSGTLVQKLETREDRRPAPSGVRPGYVVTFLLLAVGGAFALYLRRNGPPGAIAQAPIRHVGAFQLSQGQQLRLVSLNGEVLLLGVTSSQITLLKSFPASDLASETSDASEISALTYGNGPVAKTAPTFASLLQQFSGAVDARAYPDGGAAR